MFPLCLSLEGKELGCPVVLKTLATGDNKGTHFWHTDTIAGGTLQRGGARDRRKFPHSLQLAQQEAGKGDHDTERRKSSQTISAFQDCIL